MKIYLIRHTRVGTEAGLCYGATDVPLADSATVDVAVVAEKLSDQDITSQNLFSSPLSRCQYLAEALCGDYQLDERLKEMNFGRWEGQMWAEIKRSEISGWSSDLENYTPQGGESLREVYDRTASFLDELRHRSELQTAFVVTHGGAIRCMLAYALGLELSNCNRVEVDYGSLCRLHLSERQSKVEFMNR